MTIKQFAAQNGRTARTVQNWVQAYNDNHNTQHPHGVKTELGKYPELLNFVLSKVSPHDTKNTPTDMVFYGGTENPPKENIFFNLYGS
jgi:hypothetical protein